LFEGAVLSPTIDIRLRESSTLKAGVEILVLAPNLQVVRDDMLRHAIVQRLKLDCSVDYARLKDAELTELIERTVTSNKRYTPDQCAAVLEITVSDRQTLGLRFIGADDDPDYVQRLAAKKAKNAAANRRYRARHSTGRKRGRPKLEVPAWKAAGYKSKRTYQRHKALGTLAQNGTKNARCDISKNRTHHGIKVPPVSITEFSVTRPTRTEAIDSLNLATFGITAIRVMSGTNVIREWHG